MVLDNIFLLNIPPFWTILIISFAITLITTLVYKFTTDQAKMKKIREEMKEFQKRIRDLTKQDPQKAMAEQQEAMKHNMEYMKNSFKSTLYTFIPLILIFGWLNAHMAYYQIMPDQQFNVTVYFAEGYAPAVNISSIPELEIIGDSTQQIINGMASWQFKGSEGDYQLEIGYNNEQYTMPLIISSERIYAPPEKQVSNSKLQKIVIGNQRIYPLGSFSIFGWMPSWIWAYIILSLVLSIGIRKVLKVY
jgi:uncharacterized membrane protein (DUF106 family)